MSLLEVLGDTLRKPDGSTVTTADATKDADVLGLYFSAHWCGPCRGFTPTLCKKYTALKEAGKKFEMVFLSSDRDQKAFEEYHKEMTFLAVPYENREAKSKLSSKFKVQGIPTLVFYDLKADKIITDEGREEISSANFIDAFPYRPVPFSFDQLGNKFRLPKGGEGDASLLKKDVIGLYFSAHWCPPCRGFTPTLSERYTQLSQSKSVEILFVSSDRSQKDFEEYHDSMTFPALPYELRDVKEQLSKTFKVGGIPTLVFVDGKTGDVITSSGRGAISADTFLEDFPYHPKPMYDLEENCDGINEDLSLVVLMEEVAASAQAPISAALLSVAQTELAKKEDDRGAFRFFTGAKIGIASRVRELCKLGDPGEKAEMVLLSCDTGSFYKPGDDQAEPTAQNMADFLKLVKDGKIESTKFS